MSRACSTGPGRTGRRWRCWWPWLSVPDLGATTATMWFAAVVACEIWTWISTRPAMTRALSTREMIVYVVSGAFTMPAWAMLGTMFWFTGQPDSAAIAVALWVGQLLYTQRFIFQSYLAILMGNAVMVCTMVAVPLLYPQTLSGTNYALFEIGLLFCLAFTISASLAAYARVRSLADQNAAIQRAAVTDELTALPNRLRFTLALEAAVTAGSAVWVLYMDLDRFKNVNDTLGHQAGDALLRQFAGRLLAASPPGALVARLGGDEFAALITAPGFTLVEADALCRRIIGSVKAPFAIENGQAHVGVSIGVASSPAGKASGADLMRRADIALYSMKAHGRGGFTVFDDELETAVRSRTGIETALRATLASGSGLSLVFQPKVDRLGRVGGVEALVRWQMDDRPVSPDVFVPIAEDTGLILGLGDWVLAAAIDFAQRWPGLSVAVNLSPAQMREATFGARLLDRIARTGVDPCRIELEITETTLFESSDDDLGVLRRLRAAGLHVALDDFGTGYSSLRHLHSVSVDRVKIDRSFVAGLSRGHEAAAIIAAVIRLGHSMGIQITAEGVETEAQRDFLIEAGADELQGYLYSAPLDEAALSAWLATHETRLAA